MPIILPMIAEVLKGEPRCEIYLFGSALVNNANVADVDLLVVYQSEEDLPLVKTELSKVAKCFPLDITYMSKSEQLELDFIRTQKAKKINTLWHKKRFQ